MAYTNIDDPSAHFQAFTYTGNQSSRDITLDGNSDLQPDLYWYKARNSNHHYWVDSSRGTTKYIYSSLNNAEATVASAYVTSFNTNGFNVGGGDSGTNTGGISFANWAWKANGGTTSSNTDGSKTATVQANQDAGFSIITYAGSGSASTVGHGLADTPDVIIFKNRDAANVWAVYHQSLGNNYKIELNSTNAQDADGSFMNGTLPTSSVFTVGASVNTNGSGSNYVAYCFAEKQGYSKFGKYVGNGTGTSDGTFDGTFVYTGFKPAWVMVKRSSYSAGDGWTIWDNARESRGTFGSGKYINNKLTANSAGAESGNVYDAVDFLSNGFKLRTGRAGTNASGSTYIYMAFAENPFTTSTGIPTTAR